MEGLAPIGFERYGPHDKETVHILAPASRAYVYTSALHGPPCIPTVSSLIETSNDVVLYVHGGGFVTVNSGVLLHSVTCFCRNGFTVYSIDYPLAPQYPYPAALVSLLRALYWLKREKNVSRVHLLGDSGKA